MRIGVDRAVCEGHAQCSIVDFELFPLDDDGFSVVGEAADVPAGEEDLARLGVAACPVRALHVHGWARPRLSTSTTEHVDG